MGVKAKKALKKKVKKGSLQVAAAGHNDSADYLPLDGGRGRKLPVRQEPVKETATVLYVGRIPHGFYEDQMKGFFSQFGGVKRLRIARNKKTGKSKHYGFIEFESAEVAKIVADSMHNYLLYEHMLQVYPIPPERVHPKLWNGANRLYIPPNWVNMQRKQHDKERTVEEHQCMIARVLKRDKKRRKRIEAAGIDYACPDIDSRLALVLNVSVRILIFLIQVGVSRSGPKKIKFVEED